MSTTAKYKIETRNKSYNLTSDWSDDGVGDQNEFDSAAEARVCVRALRSYGDSWAAAEYRIVGPQGIESAQMDASAWQYGIDAQLKRLGLSNVSNGRSAMVCRIDDNGAVLADVDDWNEPMDPEELCAILEAIDANEAQEDIRDELASGLQAQ